MSKTKIKMVFDPVVAKELGTDAAIILSNIEYWVQINESNKRNFKDGKYWTYNSIDAFNKLFDYLTPSKIRTCLQKLSNKGYILKGNYNQSNYDRTTWYTVNNSICQNSQMDLSKIENGFDRNSEPIPYNNTNSNTNNNNIIKFDFLTALIQQGTDPIIAKEFMQVRKAKKAFNTETAFKALLREIKASNKDFGYIIQLCVESSWSGFKNAWLKNSNEPKKIQADLKKDITPSFRIIN
jgi:hypothetical protein